MSSEMPPADLVAEIRELRRRLHDLETAAGLESASIGAGGLRVKDGGTVEIVDGAGNVTLSLSATQLLLAGLLSVTGEIDVDGTLTVAGDTNLDGPLSVSGDTTLDGALDVVAGGTVTVDGGDLVVRDSGGATVLTLATSGMTLSGMLTILAGGQFEFQDENGDERVSISGKPDGEANLIYRSGTGTDPEVAIGALFDESTGVLLGHGLLVQQEDGTDLLLAESLAGGTTVIALYYEDGQVALQIDDELTIERPGATNDILLRVTEADGIRVAVDTDSDGIQSGQVTAGAADSAGTGFRTLRIPN